MKRIQVLDCTLRDGGYVNSWNFGRNKIQYIIDGLMAANIDYIECGYLTNSASETTYDTTLFKEEQQITDTICDIHRFKNLVAMVDFGKYDISALSKRSADSLFGIRLAFHKHDSDKIEDVCYQIKKKGYHLFMQPMLTMNYADEELVELIHSVNRIHPYAFYIVDSFGSLKKNDLQRMLYVVDHNLDDDIILGFHSHNNLQLAYSNAQLVAQLQTNRQIIIDSSIFGMGRGAGNLNTELFVEYLNDYYFGTYNIKPLLRVMDDTLNSIYNEKYWGYSLAHYISAVYNCHPNYASYLSEKNSLLSDDIESIISQIDSMHKEHYSEKYIEQMYLSYLSEQKEKSDATAVLGGIFKEKKILMIGPGKSVLEQQERLLQLISVEKVIVISINCIHEWLREQIDYIFVSNKRRFERIPTDLYGKLIITSNIKCPEALYKVPYENLLNDQEDVEDNSGMMFLKLLTSLNVDKVYIVGVDGFSYDMDENYFTEDMKFSLNRNRMKNLNDGMRKLIGDFQKNIDIEFLNSPRFLTEGL